MATSDRLMGGAQKSSLPSRKMVDSPIQSEPVSQTIATIPVRPIIINRSGPAPMPMMGGQPPAGPMPAMPMKPPMGGPAPAPAAPMPMQPPMPPGPPTNTPVPVMPQSGGGGNDFFMQQLMMAAQQGRNGGM